MLAGNAEERKRQKEICFEEAGFSKTSFFFASCETKCKGLLLYVGTKVFVLKPKPKNHPYNLPTSPKALPSQIGTAFELFIWKQ
jgi:hypothetical protein